MADLLQRKLDYWEHQLLDLGKRNRMINYRKTKRSTLALTEPGFDELYKRIAVNEETLTFRRAVDRETDIRVFSILSLLETLRSPLPVTIGDIGTEGSTLERQRTLKNLRAKARLALEEQGINILYLSFGFIEWREGKGASAQWIRSPLILVPAVLALESLTAPYTLKKHEDDIVINPTLEYYLKTEYGVQLPPFDPDKDTPDSYLTALEELADSRGWRILRQVDLGLLSFLKISMYNDLLRNRERIHSHPVIRAMAGDTAAANDIPPELQNFDLDSIGPRDTYQVMSADSSQQDAILYANRGVSFVMQGPPGAGKSQTITNIIAEALGNGKKVLFVSEKMAALQVVYRRLQDAHLGDFCLPLHSYRANKKQVLEQIGANLKLPQTRVKESAITNLEELLQIRRQLNEYARQLHRMNPRLNMSCYEVYSKLEQVADAATVAFVLEDPLSVTQSDLQAYVNVLKEYAQAIGRLGGEILNNPWQGLTSRLTGYGDRTEMAERICALSSVLAGMLECLQAPQCRALRQLPFRDVPSVAAALTQLTTLPAVPREMLLGDLSHHRAEAQLALERKDRLEQLDEAVSRVFREGIEGYDYQTWKTDLLTAAGTFVGMPFTREASCDHYVKNVSELLEAFTFLRRLLETAAQAFATAKGILNMDVLCNRPGVERLERLTWLLRDGAPLPGRWLTGDLGAKKTLAQEAATAAAAIQGTRAAILTKWEPGIFEIYYADMLLRFKTDYTSPLRGLDPRYHRDKRRLQALSRTVLSKLPNELAVEVLTQLKTYHEGCAWFRDHQQQLQQLLGSDYLTADADFKSLVSILDTAHTLMTLAPELPGCCGDLLAREHASQIAQAAKQLDICSTMLTQIQLTAEKAGLSINVDAGDLDCAASVEIVDAYLEKLSVLSRQKAKLLPYLRNTNMPVDDVYEAMDSLSQRRSLVKIMEGCAGKYQDLFGALYTGLRTDWGGVLSLLERLEMLGTNPNFPQLAPILECSRSDKQCMAQSAQRLRSLFEAGAPHLSWVGSRFRTENGLSAMPIAALAEKFSGCEAHMDQYEKWIDYQEAADLCTRSGLADFIDQTQKRGIFGDIEKVFLKGFYQMWLGAVCDQADAVRRFRRNAQDEKLEKFMELDDLQLRIAQMRIREKLIGQLPSEQRLLRATDELAILTHELDKKRNIMPLRKLFRQIPNLLLKLKPCLMMSPLSVSYFLEAEAYQFDLVIFDEASQIFPEDAIGAIFRGAQVIIVGDSKQLPPTNFFAANTGNNEDDYDVDDEQTRLEVADSILEEAAAVLPNRTLRWHYRSRHEDLIAFSNANIYGNSLITFPNSVRSMPDMGVEYVYVPDGIYDRGGQKCNVREAEECVRLVREHILKYPERSLGIIAFSETQQTAIENAITDFRERNPQYEEFFSENKEEPFFVKNLENVQGDERDTILFSICYAKTAKGTMDMFFGPLSQEGGERRLNVAITRAKCNVKLVGSILPSDFRLDVITHAGPRMLHDYIRYARTGASVLPQNATRAWDTEDGFCDVVAAFLEKNGYRVCRRVGCSDYKLDIAVVDPRDEGSFMAGIECDGVTYAQARTARDRDHLRPGVMKNMGWNLYRVWSTQWSRDPAAEGAALLAYLQNLAGEDGTVPHDIHTAAEEEIPTDSIATETEKTDAQGDAYGFARYQEATDLPTGLETDGTTMEALRRAVGKVAQLESPIYLDQLYRRLTPCFTTGKLTAKVKTVIYTAINQLAGYVTVDPDNYVRLLPITPPQARVPAPGQTPRPMEHICTREVAEAMSVIAQQAYGITPADLAAECCRVFGFERMGPRMRQKTDEAMQWLLTVGRVRLVDGKVQYIGESHD